MKKNISQIQKLVLSIVLLALPFFGYSITTFEKTTKFNGNQSAWAFVLMDDGGYVATGVSTPSGSVDQNLLVVRYDMYGAPVWTKIIGGPNIDFGYYILKSSDGNLVVAGSTANKGAGSDDFYLLKLDYTGAILWERTFGTPNSDIARTLCETKDGGFCIAGYTMTSPTNEDGYIVKTNADGTVVQWAQTIGGSGDDHFYGIKQNADESYILTGGTTTTSLSKGDMDLYLVKVGSTGNLKWQKAFGGANFDEGKYVTIAADGNYVMAGQSAPAPGNDDAYVLKTDTAGVDLWHHNYGGTEKDLARSIENTSDGGFIVGAISRSFGFTTPHMWLLKIDGKGLFQWQKLFGGDSGHQHCYQAKPTPDGYLMVGHSVAFSGGTLLNVYMVKTNAAGVLGIAENNAITGVEIFPNPATTHVNVQITSASAGDFSFKLVNVLGAEIYNHKEFLSEGASTKVISFGGLNAGPGLYFLEIQSGSSIKTEKIVIR